jgi:hypothetical protein
MQLDLIPKYSDSICTGKQFAQIVSHLYKATSRNLNTECILEVGDIDFFGPSLKYSWCYSIEDLQKYLPQVPQFLSGVVVCYQVKSKERYPLTTESIEVTQVTNSFFEVRAIDTSFFYVYCRDDIFELASSTLNEFFDFQAIKE